MDTSLNGLAHAHAWMLNNDRKLVRLRAELNEVTRALADGEKSVPENVRDLDTLVLHLQGGTHGELASVMGQFLDAHLGLRAYADLLERKWTLERQIQERKERLGFPAVN